ncbi:MAG: LamG domain-containing protein, partial [Patescibacteria group bacterium]|nr:LamG domain-containing protein [Patescibacteria group bacterium]
MLGLIQQLQLKPSSEIFTGSGVPSNTLGSNGDFYLDNTSGNYYQKVLGTWSGQGNLKGPTGPAGATGPTGPPGSQIFIGSGAPSSLLGTTNDFYLDNGTGTYYQKKVSGWAVEGILTGSVSSGVITALQNQINSLNSTARTLNQQLQFTQLNSAAFGLVSYFKFDGNTNDFSGLDNNGVVTGTSTYVPGKVGQAFSFDGGEYISLGNSATLNFERTNSFSYSYWFKGTSVSTLPSVLDHYNGTNGIVNAINTSGQPQIYLINNFGGGNYLQAHVSTVINDGNWHHVVWTYSGNSNTSGLSCYVDNSSISVISDVNSLSASIQNNNNWLIGMQQGSTAKLTGQLDDLRIYNKALSASDVS